MGRRIGVSLLVSVLVFCAVAVAAHAGGRRELPKNDFLARGGRVANLAAGVSYTASSFPLALHITIPDATWAGAQWKYDSSFQHKKTTVPPYYGWFTFEQHDAKPHQGLITIMTAFDKTPTVASVVTSFRTRGHGATLTATSAVKLGGYAGVQFDGTVEGKERAFIPFTPKTSASTWYPDAYYLNKGEAFHIDVINVRGKTVVAYIENGDLPADQFPAFLTRAETLLKALKFGG